jgi:AraC-like DNA-binding protein
VLTHPVVNVVFTEGTGFVHGPKRTIDSRTLSGAGRALGIMFRPAGFRPFLDWPATSLTDAVLPVAEVFGAAGETLNRDMATAADGAEMAALADRFLSVIVPDHPQPSEATTRIAELAAADPSLVRVDDMAAQAGLGVRALQRRFADHVGISAKAFVRRYRLYEAAEQARLQRSVDWAELAARLGYSDQSHLSRDFSALLGASPKRYALACRG